MADRPDRVWDSGAADEAESEALVALYRELGGDTTELSGPRDLVAGISGLALRPPGSRYSFTEAASRSGTPVDLARRVWAGMGLESGAEELSDDDVALLATIGMTAELIGEAEAERSVLRVHRQDNVDLLVQP